MIKRIGIMTGGGDCPGLNAVIRAVVKSAKNLYQIEVIGIMEGCTGLIHNHFRKLTGYDVSGILHQGGTIIGTSNKDSPFSVKVKENGKEVFKDLSDECIVTLKKKRIDALIMVGGDGTQTIAHNLYKKGVNVIGIPKTIDNDLMGTDVTFGFDSALCIATEAIDRVHTTAESHRRIIVVEVMGRYAGWIALHSGLAGGGDVILIPEIPFDLQAIIHSIQSRHRRGKKFSVVVVAEGAKEKGGNYFVKKIIQDSPDKLRLGGVGNFIGAKLEELTGFETRVTVLGHVQRGGSPTPFDRILGTRFGVHAVNLVKKERWGKMVSIQNSVITEVPMIDVAGKTRIIDPNCELVKSGIAVGTSFGM